MEVTCSTAFDERYDPKNVLSSNPKQFWITTGLYPHEMTFTFNQAKTINEVKFMSTGIRRVVISGCPTLNGNSFKDIGETKDLGGKDGHSLQKESIRIAQPASFLMVKFTIVDGWDDFASVHSVEFS